MDKIALQLGPLPVTWFGLLVASAFMLGLWTAARRGRRAGLGAETILDLGPFLIVGAIVGARTLYVVSYWREQFAGRPWTEVFKVYEGGLVYYGGLIGATLAGIVYTRWKRLPVWRVADALAPSVALGQVFGRVGCILNGCCYGRPTDLPWALHFPAGHPTHPGGVHPTQIYEAILSLALCLGLDAWHRRRRFDGQIFAGFLIGYAIVRSVVEVFRGDYPVRYLGGIATPAHFVSAGILVAGVTLYLTLNRRPASMP